MLAGQVVAQVLLGQQHTALGCAGDQCGIVAIAQAAGVHGVKAIHIFLGQNGIYYQSLINMLWQGQLHQDTVHRGVSIEFVQLIEERLLGSCPRAF